MNKSFAEIVSKYVNNVYLMYVLAQVFKFKNNRRIRNIVNEFREIDSIGNFSLFLDKIQPLLRTDNLKKVVYPNSENSMYGHLQSLYSYSGLKYRKTPFIHMEHGINFAVEDISDFKLDNSTVMIFQSNYKEKSIHKKVPFKPVFAIGPYVHYAKAYYCEDQYMEMKAKLGKTVVVYLSHTWEKVSIDRDYEAYKKIIKRYDRNFDSIVFCLYWADCSIDLVKYLSGFEKVHLVSAGFRGDPNFLSRTRTILELADLVVGNDIGTFVGYALYLGKCVQYVQTNERSHGVDCSKFTASRKNKQRVIDALENGEKDEIHKIYNEFWGGDCIRTPDEVEGILKLSNKIGCKSFGFKSRFSLFSKQLIENEVKNLKNERLIALLTKSISLFE